jgi:biopolymer transport protein ExbB/TolQ
MKKKELSQLEKFSERCTSWVGSPTSLVVHTIVFLSFFIIGYIQNAWGSIMLILTTIVSLEAIYLAILIQISVNRNTRSLEEVEEDVGEIQEDIDEIQEDIDEIHEESEEANDEPFAEYVRSEQGKTSEEKQEILKGVIADLEAFRRSLER